MNEDNEAEFGLVMPFVVCASQGGPYEDNAFCAGYELGRLDLRLRMCSDLEVQSMSVTVRTDSMPQVDLIAMQHGWFAHSSSEEVEGWTSLELTKGEMP